ncbi:MAG: NUDIX hydrolase [Ignavibacteriales bacterium]|nr:NUDIX hydrolase [Ignavibacteriales bacterium]
MLQPWKKLRQSFEVKNKWWTYRKDDVLLPNGTEGEYNYVHTNGSSLLIPVLDDGTILLVNQFRYLMSRESLEFPCGSVKDNSSYEETAKHELEEETQCTASEMICVGEFNPYNGVTDELCKIFIAKQLSPVNVPHDESEEFELVKLFPAEIDEKIFRGEIWDGMTIAAWTIAKQFFLK